MIYGIRNTTRNCISYLTPLALVGAVNLYGYTKTPGLEILKLAALGIGYQLAWDQLKDAEYSNEKGIHVGSYIYLPTIQAFLTSFSYHSLIITMDGIFSPAIPALSKLTGHAWLWGASIGAIKSAVKINDTGGKDPKFSFYLKSTACNFICTFAGISVGYMVSSYSTDLARFIEKFVTGVLESSVNHLIGNSQADYRLVSAFADGVRGLASSYVNISLSGNSSFMVKACEATLKDVAMHYISRLTFYTTMLGIFAGGYEKQTVY